MQCRKSCRLAGRVDVRTEPIAHIASIRVHAAAVVAPGAHWQPDWVTKQPPGSDRPAVAAPCRTLIFSRCRDAPCCPSGYRRDAQALGDGAGGGWSRTRCRSRPHPRRPAGSSARGPAAAVRPGAAWSACTSMTAVGGLSKQMCSSRSVACKHPGRLLAAQCHRASSEVLPGQLHCSQLTSAQ